MKLGYFFLLLVFLYTAVLKVNAQKQDTLSISEYLMFFDNKFTDSFNIGWTNTQNLKLMNLKYAEDKLLSNIHVRLYDNRIIVPEIYGWAYSYKKISENIYWMVSYQEGEGGVSVYLYLWNIRSGFCTDRYKLANAFGDQGDWEYKYGYFTNDSTYKYINAYGTLEHIIDSIVGCDVINSKGQFYEFKKQEFKK